MRTIQYTFLLSDGSTWEYDLQFDEQQHLVLEDEQEYAEWTALEYRQCRHCPLKSSEHPQCPVAKNLHRIVEDSKETLSTDRTLVTVQTPERTYQKETATASGLLSLFGLVMASSGCPHLDWLRPLARFHLPFANVEETLFRVLCLQLLTQYFQEKGADVAKADASLEEKYTATETVNHDFIQRIREYCKGDADKNAIAALDVFVQLFMIRQDDDFSSLKELFTA